MGRLLSPSGRKLIADNILFHNIPLIKNDKLAENIKTRMSAFSSFLPINNYKAVINVGGGVASLGTSFNSKLLPPGIVNRNDLVNINRPGGIEGVFSKFINLGVLVFIY